MPVAFRKGPRNEPWGSSACARSSTMSPASEPVREARARVMIRGALSERAARGVAVQPSRLQVADDDPLPAEIDAPEQPAGRIQRAASRRISGQAGGLGGCNSVERLARFRIGPGPLDNSKSSQSFYGITDRKSTRLNSSHHLLSDPAFS